MISDQEFNKVCRLAKLSIPEKNREQFLNKLNSIFGWIDQLKMIDTTSVDNTTFDCTTSTTERTDTPYMDNTRNELLSNTKNKKFDMFCVTKIVE